MGRYGRMASCLRHPQVQKVHPSYLMNLRVTRIFPWCLAFLAFFAGNPPVNSQEKPDRPPWAQPSTTQPQPAAPANPPSNPPRPATTPGPMVPAPVPERQKEQQTPKGAIKVNV